MVGKIVLALAFAFSLWSCGGDTNINKYLFTGEAEEDRLDVAMEKARIHYDKGELDDAEKYALKGLDLNEDNEEAAVLLGYIYLAQGGFDIFSIAKKMLEIGGTSNSSDSDSECQASGGSGKDADESLNAFKCLVSISDEEIALLSDGGVQVSDLDLFADYPVIYPKKLTTDNDEGVDPRDSINTLKTLKNVVQVLCPFVDPAVGDDTDVLFADEDYRHVCEPTTANRQFSTKSHFLWALAHLLEAVSFNTILLYEGDAPAAALQDSGSGSSSASSNLLKRVEALNQGEFEGAAQISEYLSAVTELADNISAIFDTTENSMLRITLTNLQATSRGFGKIPGVPDKLTTAIDNALQKIKDAAEEVGGATEGTDLNAETSALKGKLTKSVAQKLGKSIDDFSASGASDEEIAEACENYETISADVSASDLGSNAPDACE